MPYWRTYYHLIWATKRRQAMITPDIEAQLFAYLVHKAAEMGLTVYAVNGWTDHIHLVVSIPPQLAVAEAVKELKGASSRYINAQGLSLLPPETHFAWQEGYGVLTIGERHRHIAVEYVQRQKEHHAANQTIAALERSEGDDAGPAQLREESTVYAAEPEQASDVPF